VFKRKENKESQSTPSNQQVHKESNLDKPISNIVSSNNDNYNDNTNNNNYNTNSNSNSNSFQNRNENVYIADSFSNNNNNFIPNSSSDLPTKGTGFDFLKKRHPDSITNSDPNISNNSKEDSNTASNKANNFKFIKSKNTTVNVISPASNKELNNNLADIASSGLIGNSANSDSASKKSDFVNLDNLLNEKENYFNSILNADLSTNHLNNQNVLNSSSHIITNNEKEETSDNKDISPHIINNPPEVKKSFGFLKKKVEGKTENTGNILQSKLNPDPTLDAALTQDNNVKDEDWDNRSFKSLKINNNIKSDNIFMNIEEDNKSIKNMGDTSCISNPMKESPSNKAPSYSFNKRDNEPKPTSNNVFNFLPQPEQMKKRCYEDIAKSEESYKDIILNFYNVKVKLRTKEEELKKIHKESESLYEREEEAIANNEFDEAQSIENLITANKRRVEGIQATIKKYKEEMNTYREHELLNQRKRLKILDETLTSFKKMKSQQDYELESFQNTDLNKHKNDNIKIKKLKEKLDFLKTNLDSDKNYIDEEEEKITKVIKSQSSGVFEELEELNTSKNIIVEEIDNIKKLLDKKFSELDSVNKAIESKEIEIDAIKSNFNHEFNKLNYKKKNYDESKKDYEEQENLYEKMVKVYDSDRLKHEEKTQKMKMIISDLEMESAELKISLNKQTEDLNKKEYLLKTENESIAKLYLIDMKYVKIKSNKDKNIEEIQKMEFAIKKYEAEILGWDMKIPSLEEEKKGSVALKNFKEAGRVSNELKAIIEGKKTNLTLIEENKSKINEFKIEIENINEELEKIRESRTLEEKEMNISKYDYILSYQEEIRKALQKISEQNKDEIYKLEKEVSII
jgi:hypothetical protein